MLERHTIGAGAARRLIQECERFALVKQQLADLEKSMIAALAPTTQERITKLMRLKGPGSIGATRLVLELFWRNFENRRQVGSCVGLVPQPYDSGESRVDQGIGKQGNRRVRALVVEIAWFWLRYQPESAISKWFVERTKSNVPNKRAKRIAIVAVARKLIIAPWRYMEHGVIPAGSTLKAT